jgi:hypothetical protein
MGVIARVEQISLEVVLVLGYVRCVLLVAFCFWRGFETGLKPDLRRFITSFPAFLFNQWKACFYALHFSTVDLM